MSYPNGPVRTLPGSRRTPDKGAMCGEHPDVPSFKTIQGETDSFGAEFYEMCEACVKKFEEEREQSQNELSFCDWCKTQKTGCSFRRDLGESSTGPVYFVCPSCSAQNNEENSVYSDDYD